MLEDYLFVKNTKWVIWGAIGVVVVFLVFHAGVAIGTHQAMRHGPPHGFKPPFGPQGFEMPNGFIPGGHGAMGIIQSITLPTFILAEPDGDTEVVVIGTTTLIRIGPDSTSSNALQKMQRVVILGTPDETHERIEAKFIRINP